MTKRTRPPKDPKGPKRPRTPLPPPTKKARVKSPAAEPFKVGKGKPPREYTWTPGKSGNPGGRPKGAKNLKTIVSKAAKRKVKVGQGDSERQLLVSEVALYLLQQAVLKGDRKAILDYLAILMRFEDAGDANTSVGDLSAEDKKMLADLIARSTSKKTDPEGDES